jgi:hypothetical protein
MRLPAYRPGGMRPVSSVDASLVSAAFREQLRFPLEREASREPHAGQPVTAGTTLSDDHKEF